MADLETSKRYSVNRFRSSSPALQIGDNIITTQTEAWQVITPWGGLVWNRPAGALVDREEGGQRYLPIVDITRRAWLVMVGLTLFAPLAASLWLRRQNKQEQPSYRG